jgi:hypothetical protein
MLWWNPSVARGVLRRLAAYQAKVADPRSDAKPGKILHEMRAGEMAALHEVPFGLYYGSVDATALFVLLAGAYVERTGDEETLRELWPSIEAALAWIDGPGDPDGDGFIECLRATDQGLANQGWKDSHDAIFHADGRLAEGHIARAEVQGYVFAAKRLAARCAGRLAYSALARKLETEATRLAERFEAAFWCPEIETYALALDGNKEPCRVRTSNAGQVLYAGIVRPERAATVARGLMETRFNSGWGIRHRGQRRSALQSDVVSQRLDLAARQFPHRARICPLWIDPSGRAGVQRPVQSRHLHGFAPAAGTVLRLSTPAWSRADALSCRLLAAGVGERHAVRAARSFARARIRSARRRNSSAQSSAAFVPWRK